MKTDEELSRGAVRMNVTNVQAALMRRCIEATRKAKTPDDEMIEVSKKHNVNPNTARVLVSQGLLEYCIPSYANNRTNNHVRLKTFSEEDDTF